MTQVPPPANKAESIVRMVAGGCEYTQVMAADPTVSKKDLFDAVMLALRMRMDEVLSGAHAQRLAAIKAKRPRAYEKWNSDEDVEEPIAIGCDAIPPEAGLNRDMNPVI